MPEHSYPCIEIDPKEYIDGKIEALKENMNLEFKALQAEYTKSEKNYPTREQLDQAMKEYCPLKESDRLAKNISVLSGVIISIFLLFISVYILK